MLPARAIVSEAKPESEGGSCPGPRAVESRGHQTQGVVVLAHCLRLRQTLAGSGVDVRWIGPRIYTYSAYDREMKRFCAG